MGATVRVNDRPALATGYALSGGIQHRVHQGGVRLCTVGPLDHQAIRTVNRGQEINLSSWYLEIGDVGQPLLIRDQSLEVTIDQIVWRRAYFAQVGAVPTPSVGSIDPAFLLHQALHDFLGDMQLAPAEGCAHPPVAIATVIALKDIGDGNTCVRVFVRAAQLQAVIKIGTSSEVEFSK